MGSGLKAMTNVRRRGAELTECPSVNPAESSKSASHLYSRTQAPMGGGNEVYQSSKDHLR